MSCPAVRVVNRAPFPAARRVIALLTTLAPLDAREIARGLGRATEAGVQSIRVQLRTAVQRGLLTAESSGGLRFEPAGDHRGRTCYYALTDFGQLFAPRKRAATARPDRHLIALCETVDAVLREPALRAMNVAPAGQYAPLERAA